MRNIEVTNFRLTKDERNLLNEINRGNVNADRESNTIAIFDVKFGSCITVTGLRLMESAKGSFVAMPSVKIGDQWRDQTYFEDKGMREAVLQAAQDEWRKVATNLQTTIEEIQVKVTALSGRNDKLLGLATVNIDGLVIRGVRIMQGEENKFVAFPQYKSIGNNGEQVYKPIVFPTNLPMQQALSEAIVDKYENVVKGNEKTGEELQVKEFPEQESVQTARPAYKPVKR